MKLSVFLCVILALLGLTVPVSLNNIQNTLKQRNKNLTSNDSLGHRLVDLINDEYTLYFEKFYC